MYLENKQLYMSDFSAVECVCLSDANCHDMYLPTPCLGHRHSTCVADSRQPGLVVRIYSHIDGTQNNYALPVDPLSMSWYCCGHVQGF